MSKTAITSFFDTYSDGKINPHMLRHWVGTELFKKTRNILVAQAQLRHKNSSTTTDYYVHKDKNEQQNAVFTL